MATPLSASMLKRRAVAAVLRRRQSPWLVQQQRGQVEVSYSIRSLHNSNNADDDSQTPSILLQESDVVVPVVTRHAVSSTASSSRPNTTTITLDLERQRATELVDQLLERTRQLMLRTQKNSSPRPHDGPNHEHHHHIVAYSGGVDSSLVAALVHENVQQLGSSEPQQHSAQAVLGVSPAVPAEQIVLARRVIQHIGMAFQTTPTWEGEQPLYVANTGQACRACKTELYTTLQAVHRHATQTRTADVVQEESSSAQQQQQQQWVLHLYNGTNADDVRDPTRVGLMAAAEWDVQSPLRYTVKSDVRLAARHFGLPNWHVAASPCLRSRLALGVPATVPHLVQVDAAERFVRRALARVANMETTNLRVRLLTQRRACLEVDQAVLELAHAVYQENRAVWDAYLLDHLKFASFGMRAFASGSVATHASITTGTSTTAANDDTTTTTIMEIKEKTMEANAL